jgi:hypothetical protein
MKNAYPLRALFVAMALVGTAAHAGTAGKMISVTPTAKTADEVVAAIKSYASERKWLYFGDGKIKNGEITLVKVCIPAAGKELFAAGLEASVMTPCGNISIYTEQGKTDVALLDANYMNVIYPNEHVKKAGEMSQPLLRAMVDAVTK